MYVGGPKSKKKTASSCNCRGSLLVGDAISPLLSYLTTSIVLHTYTHNLYIHKHNHLFNFSGASHPPSQRSLCLPLAEEYIRRKPKKCKNKTKRNPVSSKEFSIFHTAFSYTRRDADVFGNSYTFRLFRKNNDNNNKNEARK